jgi:uncharacterized protein (DUF2344 family)
MIRYRFVFSKKESARYTGFLNEVEYFRSFFSNSFELYVNSKKYKFSFGPALPYGYESESEYVDVFMADRMDDEEITIVINKNLMDGFELLRFKTVPIYFPSVESLVDITEWDLYFNDTSKLTSLTDNIDSRYLDFIHSKHNENEILKLYLKKGIKLDMILKDFDINNDIKKIVRKNLYWLDAKGGLRLI